MRTCRASQCQDGDEVLKCYEWRCQGIKASLRKPKDTKEHIKKDCINKYFFERLEFLVVTTNANVIGHFRVPKDLTFKARLSAKLLI